MLRRIRALAAGVALAVATVLSGAPASAHHGEADGCSPPFDALNLQEQIALAEELGVPESHVYAALDQFDKNGDTILCFKLLPGGFPTMHDNRSAH
jgi:hypothetical protein